MLARGITATGPPRLRSSGPTSHVAVPRLRPSPIGQRRSPFSFAAPHKQCQLPCIAAAIRQGEEPHHLHSAALKRKGRDRRPRNHCLASAGQGGNSDQPDRPVPIASFKAILRINGTEIDLLSVKASNPSANDSKKTDHGPVTSEQVQPDFVSELLPTSDSNIVWDYSYRILDGNEDATDTEPVTDEHSLSTLEAQVASPPTDTPATTVVAHPPLAPNDSSSLTDGCNTTLANHTPQAPSGPSPAPSKPMSPHATQTLAPSIPPPPPAPDAPPTSHAPEAVTPPIPVTKPDQAPHATQSPQAATPPTPTPQTPQAGTHTTATDKPQGAHAPQTSATPPTPAAKTQQTSHASHGAAPTNANATDMPRAAQSPQAETPPTPASTTATRQAPPPGHPHATPSTPASDMATQQTRQSDTAHAAPPIPATRTAAATHATQTVTTPRKAVPTARPSHAPRQAAAAPTPARPSLAPRGAQPVRSPMSAADKARAAQAFQASKQINTSSSRRQPNAEQAEAVRIALSGKNLCLVGAAGVGKTFTLQRILQGLRGRYPDDFYKRVAVCALTGMAASHLNGWTVHMKFGFGPIRLFKDLSGMLGQQSVIRALKVLVLDEISMASAEMIEILDYTLRQIRGNNQPFGGLQLIFCGDMAQLPPIYNQDDLADLQRQVSERKDKPGFQPILHNHMCFQASVWDRLNLHHVELIQVMRQSDAEFVQYLMDIRKGGAKCATALGKLAELTKRPLPPEALPVRLYKSNAKVNEHNALALSALGGDAYTFNALDEITLSGSIPPKDLEKAKQGLERSDFFARPKFVRELTLKGLLSKSALQVGSQVMLLKNMPRQRLVNGSVGKVVGFEAVGATTYPLVEFPNCDAPVIITPKSDRRDYPDGLCHTYQIPLKLAWALTVHKSQGLTLDHVQVDLSDTRDIDYHLELIYVALSRVRSMDGLQILSLPEGAMNWQPNPVVTRFYETIDDPQALRSFLAEEGQKRQQRTKEVHRAIDDTWSIK